MKIFKKLILLSFIYILTSCGTLKEGFKNQKKNSSDEFLVEKKSPLIMPPDYNELPVPNAASNQALSEENSIKNLVTNEEKNTNTSNANSSESTGLEESLLEKIKNN
tara:strand:- start:239 stop:559 length:321 start_codon:yes stop_codon:yes gene_type:complete